MVQPLRLLLIEDSLLDTEILLQTLRDAGCEANCTRVEADQVLRAALDAGPWDVVIADQNVPGLDIIDVLTLLRERALDVPVIVIASDLRPADIVATMRAGAKDYIAKDDYARLVPSIEHELREAAGRRAKREADGALRVQARILEMVDQAVMVTDLDGVIQYWNRYAETLYGWSAAEVVGQNFRSLALNTDGSKHIAEIMATLRSGKGRYSENTRRRRDGSTFPAMMSRSPLFDRDGAQAGIISFTRDLSDAEEALRVSDAWFRALSEQATDLVAVLDAEGIFTYAGPSHLRILGYEPQFVVGQPVLTKAHPDDAPTLRRLWEELLTTEEPRSAEFRLRHFDGSWRTLETTAVNRLADPAVRGIIATSRDVTVRKQAEEARWASEARFRGLFEHAPIGVALINRDGRFIMANPAVQRILGYGEADFRRLTIADITHPDDAANDRTLFEKILAGEYDAKPGKQRYIHKDGHVVWAQLAAAVIRDEDGVPRSMIGMMLDVTERHKAEQALRHSEQRFRHLVEQAPIAISVTNARGYFESVNPAYCELYGYAADQLIGRHSSFIVPEERRGVVDRWYLENVEPGLRWSGEYQLYTGDGRERTALITMVTMSGVAADPVHVSFIVDITERKRIETELIYQASHDALTTLANRSTLHERLGHILGEMGHRGGQAALLLLDLDQFKDVNDTLGHSVGDRLLCAVSRRLEEALGAKDTIARLGGDEFAIILPNVDLMEAEVGVKRVLNSLEAPFVLDGQALAIGASIGIALAAEPGLDVSTMLRRADVAMYSAKRTRSGHAVYDPTMDLQGPRRLALLRDLKQALSASLLALHYQPKIAVRTGHLLGVEALLRWAHPEHGFIPPDQFIPLAEQSGLIGPLTTWVVREALEQYRKWHRAGTPIPVAVNLSARNLQDSRLPELISDLLRQYAVPPSQLTLEVTETAVMADPVRALDVLTRLHDLGVRLSLDDFGTGYSSLSYLKDLPVDEVKIDKSFVPNIGRTEDSKNAAIVRAVVSLSHALELDVIAEGVETREAWDALVGLGCDTIQGYYISRALSSAGLDQWLQNGRLHECGELIVDSGTEATRPLSVAPVA